ncbi:protein spaetzle-like [Panonychus citri]|uniref:protein spaetzle-like n=1 Tax=Panonychus citri TaxID=50023 RepID=UPI002307B5E5|nr:protein spaetzle-like [Panonychus citri]XP_053214606.1 protein spaetzle-like [Panonychus citri]XP_053214607.1 protein spaetzle-like [Panonychus citri]
MTSTCSQSSSLVNLVKLLTFIMLIVEPGLSLFHKSFRGRLDVYDLTVTSDNRSEVYQTNSRFLMNSSSKPIVFPTSSPLPAFDHQPQARPKVLLPDLNENGVPKCVKQPDDTFCEQVDNYPRVDLRSDFGLNLDEFRDIFGEVKEIDARKSYFDDDSADERICGGPRKIVFPKMAKTQSKRWVYIVNDDENFRQSVVTEICSRPGKPCAYLEDDNLPAGLSSQCRQKYARARLMALHPTEQRTYPEYFEFPSCCACYIKNPYNDRGKFRQ